MNRSLPRAQCLLFVLLMSFGLTAHAQILERIFLDTSLTNTLSVESWSWELGSSENQSAGSTRLLALPGNLVVNRLSNRQSIVLMHAFNERTVIPRVELTRGVISIVLTNAVIVGFDVEGFVAPTGNITTAEAISFQGQRVSYSVNGRDICVDAENQRGCAGVLY